MSQALHYRLVGEGRLEGTEKVIEALYHTHYYVPLPNGKMRDLPNNRATPMGYLVFFCFFLAFDWRHMKLKTDVFLF